MSSKTFVFAWNGQPKGGVNDLIAVCDSLDEATALSNEKAHEYDFIQVMCDDGEIACEQETEYSH